MWNNQLRIRAVRGFLMIDLTGFEEYLIAQQCAENTIYRYRTALRKLPVKKEAQKKYITEHRTSVMKILAYRKYLQYQRYLIETSGKKLTEDQKAKLLDIDAQLRTFKKPKKTGNTQNGKWFPHDQWENIIANAPHRSAKMGIWIGFQFGLRVGEIINLRIQDVDLNTNFIHIQVRKDWHPKYNRNRSIPIPPSQKETLVRWITERPKLDHPYLIYTSRNNQVTDRSFHRWCKTAHPELSPHDLRRSFAKVLYYESKKDLKLVQILLGHSNIGTTSTYLSIDTEEIHEKFTKAMG